MLIFYYFIFFYLILFCGYVWLNSVLWLCCHSVWLQLGAQGRTSQHLVAGLGAPAKPGRGKGGLGVRLGAGHSSTSVWARQKRATAAWSSQRRGSGRDSALGGWGQKGNFTFVGSRGTSFPRAIIPRGTKLFKVLFY